MGLTSGQALDALESARPVVIAGQVGGPDQVAVQLKSSAKERMRGAGRVAILAFGSSGMIVITQAAGTLDLLSTIDRTWPVIVESADRAVAVLPLNWAIRKRRTSFGSLVANVNMRVLLGPRNYRDSTLSVCENRMP
jgi:hypothetical protein